MALDPRIKRLYATDDAMVWAKEFMDVVRSGATVDEGLMVGWFANAMVTAVDHDKRRSNAEKLYRMPVTVLVRAADEGDAFYAIAEALHASPKTEMVGGEKGVEVVDETT